MTTGIYLEPGKSVFAQKTYYKIIKYFGQGGNTIALDKVEIPSPLVENKDIREPIQLSRLGRVVDIQDGGLIFNLLRSILGLDYKERAKIDELLSNLTMLYEKIGRR